jgi:hypothetical protein
VGADDHRVQARQARGQHQLQDLHAVFHQHGHRVAGRQALAGHPLRQLARAPGQRARRVLLAAVAHGQRNAVGPGIGPAVEVMHACLLGFLNPMSRISRISSEYFSFSSPIHPGKRFVLRKFRDLSFIS